MAYLQLDNIQKSFGDTHVIKGVDLQIEKGEFIVFVGPSGCGKSTLLRLIAGLEPITSGTLSPTLGKSNPLGSPRARPPRREGKMEAL